MKLRQLGFGIATFIPGVNRLHAKGTGGTDSARYCYSVWLRHLVMTSNNGLNTYPKVVAELGPGDSLGIGLAALVAGAEKYFAFDIVEHTNIERNLEIFDELVALFKNKEDIPGEQEFPGVKPYLDTYSFPQQILTDPRLVQALEDDRIDMIRSSIINQNREYSIIKYVVPWFDPSIIGKESVDLIYSQAVLEHVDDLRNTYRSMRSWLKPQGFVSHQIDFRCHGMTDEWNGHWTYSDFMWKLIRGNRAYLLNREPHSTHIRILEEEGFNIVCDKKTKLKSHIARNKLAQRFKDISDDDLTTSSSFIQAIKQY